MTWFAYKHIFYFNLFTELLYLQCCQASASTQDNHLQKVKGLNEREHLIFEPRSKLSPLVPSVFKSTVGTPFQSLRSFDYMNNEYKKRNQNNYAFMSTTGNNTTDTGHHFKNTASSSLRRRRKKHSFFYGSPRLPSNPKISHTRMAKSTGKKKRKYFNVRGKPSNSRVNDVSPTSSKTGNSVALYTNWSRWSRCSRHCQQSRRRRCRIRDLCGSAVIKEKRPCIGWRCQHKKFHLIKPNEIYGPHSAQNEKQLQSSTADVRVLLNYNSMFYTRWSEWAACSRTCLTSRYRSCRYSLFCGNTVIREEAYCYTQDSGCEKWYHRHKFNSVSDSRHQANQNSSSHETFIQGDQVIFGHKFITENSVSPPTQHANILNFQIGATNHKHASGTAGLSDTFKAFATEQNLVTEKNNNKNKYLNSNLDKSFPFANRFSFNRPKYLNQLRMNREYKEPSENKLGKEVKKKISYAMSVGRPNSLPKKCGVSLVKKPPWTLRIIGGRESPPGKWPWQIAILNRFKEVYCGGTLITAQWIVTAAHCLRKRLYVRLAEHDLAITEGAELEFRVTEMVSHPLYDSTTVDNDVALLRLPEPVQRVERVTPVCIPEQGHPLPYGNECTIIGWGKDQNTRFFGTDVLNEAEVPIIDEETCREVYKDYFITLNMFCAGYQKGRIDSCAGDSGGPLLCFVNGLWYIYGITSFGEGCGRKGKFGIYTKVSNYRTWINDVIAAHAHRDHLNTSAFTHIRV